MAKKNDEYPMPFHKALMKTVETWWKVRALGNCDPIAIPDDVRTIIQFLRNVYDIEFSFDHIDYKWIFQRELAAEKTVYTR